LLELAESMMFYLLDTVEYDPAAAKKFLTPAVKEAFLKLMTALEQLEIFDEANLERVFKQIVVDELHLKLGKVAQPVRVSLTGMTASPGLFEVIDVLGKDAVLKRMRVALDYIG
jgi:glutamyl-tRNA synthetase